MLNSFGSFRKGEEIRIADLHFGMVLDRVLIYLVIMIYGNWYA